ncbi:MAG: hypothetical protein F4Z92_06990, partial [Gemmatimonadetes bacterium]|nr:hypothetical protein [Gemmatimonadota bacterium]
PAPHPRWPRCAGRARTSPPRPSRPRGCPPVASGRPTRGPPLPPPPPAYRRPGANAGGRPRRRAG